MPKNKTHSGTERRFRTTDSGKLICETTNKRHLLEYKSSRYTRRLSQDQVVVPPDVERVKELLGK